MFDPTHLVDVEAEADKKYVDVTEQIFNDLRYNMFSSITATIGVMFVFLAGVGLLVTNSVWMLVLLWVGWLALLAYFLVPIHIYLLKKADPTIITADDIQRRKQADIESGLENAKRKISEMEHTFAAKDQAAAEREKELQDTIDNYNAQNADLRRQAEDVQRAYEKFQNEHDEKSIQYQKLIGELTFNNTTLNSRVEKLTQEKVNLETELKNKRTENVSPAAQTTSTSAVTTAATPSQSQLFQQVETLRRDNAALEAKIKNSGDSSKVSVLESTVKDMNQALATNNEERSRLIQALNLSASRLESCRDETKRSLQRQQQKFEEMRSYAISMQQELSSIKQDGDKRKALVENAMQQLQSLRPFVGLRIETAPAHVTGVLVKKVLDGTPAQASGILENDIVEQINLTDCTSSSSVMDYIAQKKPGDTISLQVNRNGAMHNAVIEIGSKDLDRDSILRIRRRALGIILPEDLNP